MFFLCVCVNTGLTFLYWYIIYDTLSVSHQLFVGQAKRAWCLNTLQNLCQTE